MKEKKEISRREWVKSVAIVFLSIMLVLTFFSNTILNYSLAQVSTEFIQSGIISAKIRGTGVVKASDPYEIVATETRTVTSVKVTVGDSVSMGDILLELEDVESDELVAERAALEALELDYATSIISSGLTTDQVAAIENGNLPTLTEMQTSLAGLKAIVTGYETTIAGYEATVASLNAEVAALGYIDTSTESQAVTNAQSNVTAANAAYSTAENTKNNAQATYETAEAAYQNALAKKSAYDSAKAETTAAQAAKNDADAALAAISVSGNEVEIAQAQAAVTAATSALSAAQTKEAAAKSEYDACGSIDSLKSTRDSALNAYNTANSSFVTAVTNQVTANNTLASAQQTLSNKADASEQIKSLNRQLAATNGLLAEAQLNLAAATTNYTTAQKLYTDELVIANKYAQIVLAEAKIAELESKSIGATVDAPVAGTIASVTIVAGEKMKADQVVITIQPAGKEMTVSLTVTSEQAAKVSVGDVADVSNSWYYGDISVTLIQIKNDPNNPGKGKILVFSVRGEVESGATLDISVGDRSNTYDNIVPLSAIREDKNGKYVLIIEEKSSPLGNRYIARRLDVVILAQDDVHAAIQAEVESYSYVITTASKPVKPGDQVRFYD